MRTTTNKVRISFVLFIMLIGLVAVGPLMATQAAESVVNQDYAYLQVAHLAPFAEDASVTIQLNGVDALTDFNYGDSTAYLELEAGSYDIDVIPTGTTDPAIEATVVRWQQTPTIRLSQWVMVLTRPWI
jgi:hypothetical protein